MPIVVVATFATAPAFAEVKVNPSGPWRERINTCVALWERADDVQRGTMTYRQFTTKCVGGKTAFPHKTAAVCEDGTRSTGNAPEGACARNGGVAKWLN